MRTRLAEPMPQHADVADHEFAADKIVERDAARNEVSPRLTRRERNRLLACYCVDRLRLDQRQLRVRLEPARERARGAAVPVALEASPWNGARLFHRGHGGLRGRRDED